MTGRVVWCLPSVDPVYQAECLATLAPGRDLVVIDNSPPHVNLGVAASWNVGIGEARSRGAEWVVLLSESMRFGPQGGLDFEAALQAQPVSVPWVDGLFGWHLIAFRVTTFDLVGLFDETFWPAYFEDTDMLFRLGLAGLPSPRENDLPRVQLVDIDAWHMGTEHSIREGLVRPNIGECAAAYERKWGGPQGSERFRRPYNAPGRDWSWCPRMR